MSACNWAVVGVRTEDAEVAPIGVFEKYEDARDSMLCKIRDLIEEAGLTSYIDDCGQDVDVYFGGKDCCFGGSIAWKWHVKQVYC